MAAPETVVRLHQAWTFWQTSDRIELWSVESGQRLRLRGSAQLGLLMSQLAEGVPARTAVSALAGAANITKADVARLLEQLAQAGATITGRRIVRGRGPDRELFDPQLNYFGAYERRGVAGADYQARLAAASVLLAGLGGIGSWVALLLSRIGVGAVVAIDADTVELSNLSRQVLFSRDDVAAQRPKVDAARKPLLAANPELAYVGVQRFVREPGDVEPFARQATVAVLPLTLAGQHRFRDNVAAACIAAGTPFLTCGQFATGPLCIPGISACHACAVDDPRFESSPPVERPVSTGAAPDVLERDGRFAPWIAMAAARAVDEVVRHICGHLVPLTLGGMLVSDLRQGTTSLVLASRRLDCRLCGGARPVADPSRERRAEPLL